MPLKKILSLKPLPSMHFMVRQEFSENFHEQPVFGAPAIDCFCLMLANNLLSCYGSNETVAWRLRFFL